jgi:signal transduction histidine kinase
MVRKRMQQVVPPAGAEQKDFAAFSQEILQSTHGDAPLAGFLRQAAIRFLEFFACDAVELWVKRADRCLGCKAEQRDGQPLAIETQQHVCRDASLAACTESCRRQADGMSRIALPLVAAAETIGSLQLTSRQADFFSQEDRRACENLAQTLALALVSQFAHAALRERIKELTCLYQLAQLAETPGITAEQLFGGIAQLLPAAWQYPEIAAARIVLDGVVYATANYGKFVHRQSAEIMIGGHPRGAVDVVYLEHRPELDEGPFLDEERSLIAAVARQIPVIVQRREAAEEEQRLQEQLRHADRLATIGQLAAGVAHELNEPLGNILAFAQLAEKQPGLPRQAAWDLEKIVAASLHAREIIKKLMLFARQMPPQRTMVDLKHVIEEGLGFLESRCAKNNVVLKRRLSQRVPRIPADPAQLNQVLVNLVVNAIQAMPAGGVLKITTSVSNEQAVLVVEDDGVGMKPEVLQRIFIPFFTTKDIHEGTGLGLPVVHGIVTSHGGTIAARSRPGRGTRFEIRLPVHGRDDGVPGQRDGKRTAENDSRPRPDGNAEVVSAPVATDASVPHESAKDG